MTPIAADLQRDWVRAQHALLMFALGVCWLFWRDAKAIVSLWLSASTYRHCLFVPPIIAGLVWQKREILKGLQPRVFWPAVLLTLIGILVWMIGDAAGVALVRHVALVLMLISGVLVLLGVQVARCLAFHFIFAFFAVPFGDELVPQLQIWTAQMALGLLNLAGVPAYLNGIFLVTSNGLYRVAEACAGVKFLLAMVAYGCLFSYLYFQSWQRRAAFVLFCAVAPLLANGVRVFATVYVGYKTSPELAGGVDHIVYGWVFFGVVMAGVTALGFIFQQASPNQGRSVAVEFRPARPHWVWCGAAAACLLPMGMAAFWVDLARDLNGTTAHLRPIVLDPVAGWQAVPRSNADRPWYPVYRGADQLVLAAYQNGHSCQVDVALALYAQQDDGRELVGFGQGRAAPDTVWTWVSSGPYFQNAQSDIYQGLGGHQRVVVTYYWVGDRLTGSAAMVKWATLWARLTAQSQSAAAYQLSAVARPGQSSVACLRAFVRALGAPSEPMARALRAARG